MLSHTSYGLTCRAVSTWQLPSLSEAGDVDLARAVLNRAYAPFEQPSSPESRIRVWRVTDPKLVPSAKPDDVLAVQLAHEDDQAVRITYILGRSTACSSSGE